MTEISTLGEFGLIDHLTADLKPVNDSTLMGVGDDCAVMRYTTDAADPRRLLSTTDMLMEGIHFDLTYTPPNTSATRQPWSIFPTCMP